MDVPSHKVSAHCGIEMKSCPICHGPHGEGRRDKMNMFLQYSRCHLMIVVMQMSQWH